MADSISTNAEKNINAPSSYDGDPLLLHSSDQPGMQIVSIKLNGHNYLGWGRAIKIALTAKLKLGFITGKVKRPSDDSPNLDQWIRVDSMVICWILNAIVPALAEAFVYASSAQELWTEISERFGQSDGPLLFQLQKEINDTAQGNESVAVYFTKLKKLWDELNCLYEVPKCTCGKCVCGVNGRIIDQEQKNRLIQFLMGMNEEFDSARGQILLLDPLPNISKAYSMLQQVEKQKQVVGHMVSNTEMAAYSINKASYGSKPPADWTKGMKSSKQTRTAANVLSETDSAQIVSETPLDDQTKIEVDEKGALVAAVVQEVAKIMHGRQFFDYGQNSTSVNFADFKFYTTLPIHVQDQVEEEQSLAKTQCNIDIVVDHDSYHDDQDSYHDDHDSSPSPHVDGDGNQDQPSLPSLLSAPTPTVSLHSNALTKTTKEAITNDIDTTSETVLVPKRIGLYTSSHKILLVGEGDFSFSASLAVAFGSASNMVATSLNSKEFLLKHYGNFSANNKELVTRGCIVLHGIDATQMETHPQLSTMKFDRIVFNFPHSGFRSKETPNIELGRHQKLVSGFLRNAKKMIDKDGQIHIRHKCNDVFLKWNIPKIGSDQGLFLIQETRFKPNKYPGYHPKYGFGGDRDFECHPSKDYMFGLTSASSIAAGSTIQVTRTFDVNGHFGVTVDASYICKRTYGLSSDSFWIEVNRLFFNECY